VFEEGSVEEILPQKLLEASSAETTLILDPPSEGISELVVMAIVNAPPQKIIYVSCNPATLARDIKRLSTHYKLQESNPLDMFPQTAEIESINILTLHGANH
jgi:23S rRNA (uracil1939-C5)-methyltransferase